jgi:hypothetical protein
MQQLRRWVPGPSRDAVGIPAPAAAFNQMAEVSAKDIAFCSEFAFHGGIAVSEQGFEAEAELVRMRQAGLLELQRDQAPPFAVTRVALSPSARAMLSGRGGIPSTDDGARKPAAVADPKQDYRMKCNGFEVARGMMTAAVKAELASWTAAGGVGGIAGLELRILTRVSQIKAPFVA